MFILGFLLKLIVFILVIGVLVLVHEFGHFIVAKMCGVGVLKFAVGFGPPIVKFKKGDTVYQIGWIPLGGFVRMVGDIPDMITGAQATDEAVRMEDKTEDQIEGESEAARRLFADRSCWFIEKGFWAKSAIVFAGPLFNFVFAFFVASYCGFQYGERVQVDTPVLGEIIKNSPGERAGLKEKDLVKSIDGVAITKWKDLATTIHGANGRTLLLQVEREGKPVELSATPQGVTVGSGPESKKVYFLGISPYVEIVPVTGFSAFRYGWDWISIMTKQTYTGLWGMFRGQVSPNELAGPIFIFQEAGRQVEKGFESLFYFMAIISVSLAVLNLLPIPVLDGGHLLFFLIEALIGPIGIKKKEVAQQIGMLFLLCLMAFALRNDVVRKAQPEQADWDTMHKQHEATNGTQNAPAPAPSTVPQPAPATP